MVHATDKPSLKHTIKGSTYSPDYAKAIRYLNRTRRDDHLTTSARINIILLLSIISVSILVAILSSL